MQNYPFRINNNNEGTEYYFEVENELLYYVSFKKSFWLVSENSYEINIENSLRLPNSGIFDSKLMPTILEVIRHFLASSNKHSITYICYSRDSENRGKARARLFKSLFEKYNTGEYFHTQSKFYNHKKFQTYYTGLIAPFKNPDLEEITSTFDIVNQELNK